MRSISADIRVYDEQFLRFEKLLSHLITSVAHTRERVSAQESTIQQLQQQIIMLEAYVIALLEKEHQHKLYPVS